MKTFFALFSFLVVFNTAEAQLFSKEKVQNNQNMDKARLSWGYYLGINNLDFKFDYNNSQGDIQTEKTIGFNVGLIGNLRINDHIDFRLEPGLIIAQRDLMYPTNYFAGVADVRDSDLLREVKSTYIYVPLLLKLSTKRVNNIKPFILAGVSTAINLSSNQDNPDDNSSGEFRSKKNPGFYELGLGIDIYLYWFKFTPSIRGVFGTADEIIKDNDIDSPWTGNINSMKTRGIFINFTFQ